MMRSEVGRNIISNINADVRRSYQESMLRIQAFTEEVPEEEKNFPTKEEMQEMFARVIGKFMRGERETATLTGEFMRRCATPRRAAAATLGRQWCDAGGGSDSWPEGAQSREQARPAPGSLNLTCRRETLVKMTGPSRSG
jgi:hypothetical protein